MARPLEGVRVVDFSTLLPGPLATLILAEAGAEVIKIERPGGGDELRAYAPRRGAASVGFALLNRGKRSLALDLKDGVARARLEPLLASAQVLVEQFRPGVMDRLGLGYAALRELNPGIVYCSITGYGQTGPKAGVAGHDLNYLADTGLLALGGGAAGAPGIPPGLIADIGGGALPAVVSILLALRQAAATRQGCHLDIAMTDNLFAWQWWALGLCTSGSAPRPGGEFLTGGSPRYQVYRTSDARYLAAAPLEQRFWDRFCELIELPADRRDDARDPAATRDAVARIIGARAAAHWQARFAGQDCCCNLVASLEEALADPHFRGRGLFDAEVEQGGERFPALPVPLAPVLRGSPDTGVAPQLGEANHLLAGA
jgi:crotonobetainyl-CoA:carnitine CoA-transferase CaiB-like acyl-CoA transferase